MPSVCHDEFQLKKIMAGFYAHILHLSSNHTDLQQFTVKLFWKTVLARGARIARNAVITGDRTVNRLFGRTHIHQLALLPQPFQMNVCSSASHAAQILEIAAQKQIMAREILLKLHVYLHDRELEGMAGVFATEHTDIRQFAFQPDVGTEADAFQTELQVLVRGLAGYFLRGFQRGGEVTEAFDMHLAPFTEFLTADFGKAIQRVHHVANRERAAGMHAFAKLAHGHFSVEQRAGMEPPLVRIAFGTRILIPVI